MSVQAPVWPSQVRQPLGDQHLVKDSIASKPLGQGKASARAERLDGLSGQAAPFLHVRETTEAQPVTILGGRARSPLLSRPPTRGRP
jgi:hypothetical protein